MPFLGPAPWGLRRASLTRATSLHPLVPHPLPACKIGVRDRPLIPCNPCGAWGPHGHLSGAGHKPFPVPTSQEPGFLNKCFAFLSQLLLAEKAPFEVREPGGCAWASCSATRSLCREGPGRWGSNSSEASALCMPFHESILVGGEGPGWLPGRLSTHYSLSGAPGSQVEW